MEQLTKQQKKFVKEYIKTLNGEQAAKNAGYRSIDLKEIANNLLCDDAFIK